MKVIGMMINIMEMVESFMGVEVFILDNSNKGYIMVKDFILKILINKIIYMKENGY